MVSGNLKIDLVVVPRGMHNVNIIDLNEDYVYVLRNVFKEEQEHLTLKYLFILVATNTRPYLKMP